MPLWRIFAHPETFSHDQRKGLAEAVTKLYKALPAFYVNVIFIDVKEEQVWVGGQAKSNFVRIVVEHIAR
jgi:phenylpyruvate tautomerase PptA (4-oxalocrotonate tautomerase family)